MSVDLSKLPLEELLFLEAVEAMHSQWSRYHNLDSVVECLLRLYGFDIKNDPDGWDLQWDNLNKSRNESVLYKDYIGYSFGKNDFNFDRTKLNARTECLLCILAGQVWFHLRVRFGADDLVAHLGDGAGEDAFSLLAKYKMLRPADSGGFMTHSGKEAARIALSEDFNPFPHFTFDEDA